MSNQKVVRDETREWIDQITGCDRSDQGCEAVEFCSKCNEKGGDDVCFRVIPVAPKIFNSNNRV